MGNARPKQAGVGLEVQVVFERHRISDQCLIAAYEHVLQEGSCDQS